VTSERFDERKPKSEERRARFEDGGSKRED
jgi:hypothetical protein